MHKYLYFLFKFASAYVISSQQYHFTMAQNYFLDLTFLQSHENILIFSKKMFLNC